MAPGDWLCGCYYTIQSNDYYVRFQKHYLPLVDSSAHSTILSTTSRTVLTQTFTNPSSTEALKSVIYTFPLYDGVSVVSFTCRIGDKVLKGIVKEKFKAKKIFDEAVARGETAGLLEQAPEAADVFSTKLGNIPAGESVIVEITYVGELKHTETEGIRFTIPTSIAPRYGAGPAVTSGLQPKADQGIKITVDVKMPEGSNIKGVQSPSHPISVALGTLSTAKNADPSLSNASATLSLGSAALEKDFVLIVSAKDVGTPKAFLETHPTIPNHRALMATLVPKFALPQARPEVVFVADRSGSMSGNIEMLVSAMTVFLKSLPAGVKFNICSFGSSYSFLWPQSQSYTAETVAQASEHLKTFSANMGGTETFDAIKATVDRRFSNLPLEIMLLTDGDIWRQNELFEYVNQQVEQTKGKIRVFPLGIGSGVSHSLIEGLARAGNGFASAVQDGERLDSSVVKMLRGALSPHITDYTLEVKYEQEDDDFEVIEKVTEGFKVLLTDDEKPEAKTEKPKATISLFDSKVDPEKDDIKGSELEVKLPNVPFPHLHQAPHKIPSLFAFSRTSVYLLLSPETIQRNPTSIILRGTSKHGPLSLEIPVEMLPEPGFTIHQLAAKKAVQDLEEGRGWIYDAKDQNAKLVKDRYPSCFQDLVKKEAVRLGEKFQIAGKWTSFVAVAANDEESAAQEAKTKTPILEEHPSSHAQMLNNVYDPTIGQDTTAYYPTSPGYGPQSPTFFGDTNYGHSPNSPSYSPVSATELANPFAFEFQAQEFNSNPNEVEVLQDFDFDSFLHSQKKMKFSFDDANLDGTHSSAPLPGYASFGGPSIPQSAPQTRRKSSQSSQLESILQRGEKLDESFAERTEALEASSQQFYKGAKKQRSVNPFAAVSSSIGGLFDSSPKTRASRASGTSPFGTPRDSNPSMFGAPQASSARLFGAPQVSSTGLFGNLASVGARPANSASLGSGGGLFSGSSGGLFGSSSQSPAPQEPIPPQRVVGGRGGLFGSFSASTPGAPPTPPALGNFFNNPPPLSQDAECNRMMVATDKNSSGVALSAPPPKPVAAPAPMAAFGVSKKLSARITSNARSRSTSGSPPASTPVDWTKKSPIDRLHAIIALQDFDGSWSSTSELIAILGFDAGKAPAGVDDKTWVTLIVIKVLEDKLSEEEGTWGLVVEKAKGWLAGLGDSSAAETEAGKFVENAWR